MIKPLIGILEHRRSSNWMIETLQILQRNDTDRLPDGDTRSGRDFILEPSRRGRSGATMSATSRCSTNCELAVFADEAGFDVFATTEHHFHSEGYETSVAPLLLYADLAARPSASSFRRSGWCCRHGIRSGPPKSSPYSTT